MTSAPTVADARSIEEKLEWVEQLKREKREAMDRCEKKNVLSTGAAESIQRRLQGNTASQMQASPEEIAQIAARSREDVRTASPAPSSLPSQLPTLSSTGGRSWEVVSSDSPASTPTQVLSTTSPSTIRKPEFPFVPEIDTHNIALNLVSPTPPTPEESPVIQMFTPATPRRLPTAAPEPENTDPYLHRELSQLFSCSIPIFDEADIEDRIASTPPTRNATPSPTRKPVPASRTSYYSAQDLPFRNKHNQSCETLSSLQSDSLAEQSSLSSGSAHSLSRASSTQTNTTTSSRRPGARRAWSLQVDKLLPPVADGVEPLEIGRAAVAANSPEPAEPPTSTLDRSQTTLGASATSSYGYPYGFRTPLQPRFGGDCSSSLLPPVASVGIGNVYVTESPRPVANYDKPAVETTYKFHSKDSCFSTCISTDGKHAVFLSPHSFQVFAIPTPELEAAQPLKPKFHYRLGDWEGLRKGKVRWQYIAVAVSDRYVVTITKERVCPRPPPAASYPLPPWLTFPKLQVHDLAADNHVIYNDTIKGWEYSAVSISTTMLIVGLSKPLKSEAVGMIRLYRQNGHSYDGHRYECVGKDIHLPIHPRQPQDSPHIITLSRDGRYVACATPRFGYYFVWNIACPSEPVHLATSRTSGEILTSVTLLPDARHLLVSTLPANYSNSAKKKQVGDDLAAAGAFTEAMYASPISGMASQRQMLLLPSRIFHATVSPSGDAAAVLGRNGNIWVTPLVMLDGDDNMTGLPPNMNDARLLDPHSGKVAFTGDGKRIAAVDRKGRCLVMSFVERFGLGPSEERSASAEGMLGSSLW